MTKDIRHRVDRELNPENIELTPPQEKIMREVRSRHDAGLHQVQWRHTSEYNDKYINLILNLWVNFERICKDGHSN